MFASTIIVGIIAAGLFCEDASNFPSAIVVERCADIIGVNCMFELKSILLGGYTIARCNEGYTFDDDTTVRTFLCVNGTNGPTWHNEYKGCLKKIPCDKAPGTCTSGSQSNDYLGLDWSLEGCTRDLIIRNNDDENVITCLDKDNNKWFDYKNQKLQDYNNRHCPPFPYQDHLVIKPDYNYKSTTGVEFNVTCEPGYSFLNATEFYIVRCQPETFTWSEIPQCVGSRCTPLHTPANGSLSTSAHRLWSVVSITCNHGYKFPKGNITIECIYNDTTKSVQWNDTFADSPVDCIEIALVKCPSPPIIQNAAATPSPISSEKLPKYNDNVTYTCSTGYKFTDGSSLPRTITCTETGDWSANLTGESCYSPSTVCEVAPSVPNATQSSTSATNGSTITYSCKTGFNSPTGAKSITCVNGIWTPTTPAIQCHVITCPDIQPISNGTVFKQSNEYNSLATLNCNKGYTFENGNPYMASLLYTCTIDGQWKLPASTAYKGSGMPSTCYVIQCNGSLPSIINAMTPAVTNNSYGAMVTINCLSGTWIHRGVANYNATCTESGEWGPQPAGQTSCTSTICPILATWNGLQTNTTAIIPGTVANVSCQTNETDTLVLTTQETWSIVTCAPNGTWSPLQPSCVEKVKKVITIPAQRYAPPPVDAPNAKAVGASIAIAMFSVIGGFVLLADATYFINLIKGTAKK